MTAKSFDYIIEILTKEGHKFADGEILLLNYEKQDTIRRIDHTLFRFFPPF